MNSNFLNQQSGQADAQQAGDGMDQDLSFLTEEKKPINRNLLVLLVIVVVGAALVYFMYARSSAPTDQNAVSENQAKAEALLADENSFVSTEKLIKETHKFTAVLNQDNSKGQVAAGSLKTNPFAIEHAGKSAGKSGGDPSPLSINPAEDAIAKARLQTIIYSPTGKSSCIINNHVASQGQSVSIAGVSFVIKTITENSVMLQHGTREYPVELKANNLSK